jgi:hypothetical protein
MILYNDEDRVQIHTPDADEIGIRLYKLGVQAHIVRPGVLEITKQKRENHASRL